MSADAGLIQAEARDVSARATHAIRAVLGALSVEDRAIVRMRFDESVSIADISRMLRLPQRPLYRRIESLFGKPRGAWPGRESTPRPSPVSSNPTPRTIWILASVKPKR